MRLTTSRKLRPELISEGDEPLLRGTTTIIHGVEILIVDIDTVETVLFDPGSHGVCSRNRVCTA